MKLSPQELEKIVSQVLERCSSLRTEPDCYLPIEASARHVHLTSEAMQVLFGQGAVLENRRALSQPGEFLSDRRVKIVTLKGEIDNVAVLGPLRPYVQVEISRTDSWKLGVAAPVRISGDLNGAADVYLVGDCGVLHAKGSTIVAKAHIHLRPDDAARYCVADGQSVSVAIESERSITLNDVIVRVNEKYAPAIHIDYDEANACLLNGKSQARIMSRQMGGQAQSSISTPAENRQQAGTKEVQSTNIACMDKLITENKARMIVSSNSGTTVCFAKGTLITPSAKDIFYDAKVSVAFV